MRPRVFPAEDSIRSLLAKGMLGSFNEAAGIPRGRPGAEHSQLSPRLVASMRPRVFPAEDLRAGTRPAVHIRFASMRPRVFPAEDE